MSRMDRLIYEFNYLKTFLDKEAKTIIQEMEELP